MSSLTDATGLIPESDLPVVAPSPVAFVRVTENGKSRNAPLPDVLNAAALVAGAIDGVEGQGRATMQRIANDVEASAHELLAATELEANARLAAMGYMAPVEFEAGIVVDSLRMTVRYNGARYSPVSVPFITTGTFDPDQWELRDGVDADDLASGYGATMIGRTDPRSGETANLGDLSGQLRTTKAWGVPALISSYATTKLQNMLNNEQQVILTEGVYKLDEPLYPYGGSDGSPQVIRGLGNVELYQADITADVFRVGGKSDIKFVGIDRIGHRMSDPSTQYVGSGGKGISDRDSSGVSVKSDRISVLDCGFFETGMQAIINFAGGEEWLIANCRGRRLGREFFFTLNGKHNLAIGNIVSFSGDDAFAFAQNSDHCGAIGNIIRDPGRYNLGGSGIRTNGYGTLIQANRIYNPSVFGIVIAETDDETSRPDDVELIGNGIFGFTAHGGNTGNLAGIAIKNALRVKMLGGIVNLSGSGLAVPAVRVYGEKQTTTIKVEGFTARNARDLIYLAGAGVGRLVVSESELIDCTNFLGMLDNPEILEIVLRNNRDSNRGAGSVVRLDGATSPTIGSIEVRGHRSRNPSPGSTAISLAGKSVGRVALDGNEWVGQTVFSGANNVPELISDGDRSGRRINQGVATIPAGATSVTVTHGITDSNGNPVQPNPNHLEVGQISRPVAYRVGTPTSTSFTIELAAAQPVDTTIRWKVAPRPVRYVNGVAAV